MTAWYSSLSSIVCLYSRPITVKAGRPDSSKQQSAPEKGFQIQITLIIDPKSAYDIVEYRFSILIGRIEGNKTQIIPDTALIKQIHGGNQIQINSIRSLVTYLPISLKIILFGVGTIDRGVFLLQVET